MTNQPVPVASYLVSKLFSERLQNSLFATHQRAIAQDILNQHPTIQRLRACFDQDDTLEPAVREEFFQAVLRAPDPVYAGGRIIAQLEGVPAGSSTHVDIANHTNDPARPSLVNILRYLNLGFKILRDGGSGLQTSSRGSESGSSPVFESREPSVGSSTSSAARSKLPESGTSSPQDVGPCRSLGSSTGSTATRKTSSIETLSRSRGVYRRHKHSSSGAVTRSATTSSRRSNSKRPQQSLLHGRQTSSRGSKRSPYGPKLEKRRGKKICEISGYITPEGRQRTGIHGAHIIPHASLQEFSKNDPMWNMLGMFWPPNDVAELREQLCTGHNTPANGIMLKTDVHECWDDMAFYIEVNWATVTRGKYDVTFHWNGPRDRIFNFAVPPFVRDGKVYEETLETGDTITLQTIDPENAELPDPYLLLLRSSLCKIRLPKASAAQGFDDALSSLYSCDLTDRSSISDHTSRSPFSRRSAPKHNAMSARLSKKSFERAKLIPPGTRGPLWPTPSVSIVKDWIANQPLSAEDMAEVV